MAEAKKLYEDTLHSWLRGGQLLGVRLGLLIHISIS